MPATARYCRVYRILVVRLVVSWQALAPGLWANVAGIGTAFWMLPLVALWLFASVWLFSRRARALQAAGGI